MTQFVIKPSANGQWYWVFVAANNHIICQSETYYNRQDAVNSANLVKRQALFSPVV